MDAKWQRGPASEIIDALLERIVEAVHPLRIILFGSAVRAEMGPHSDIDVLVVMPEGTHRLHTAQELHRRMFGMPAAVDIVVATPADLDQHRDTIGLIYRDVLRDGREIYAA